MRLRTFLKPIIYLVAVGLPVFLIAVGFIPANTFERYGFFQQTRAFIFSETTIFSSFISQLNTIKNLIRENSELRDENVGMTAQLALYAEFESQNKFLREVLGLKTITQYEPTVAKTFNLQFDPEGHHVLLNVGLSSGIKEGDIVISSFGILIGQIIEVNQNFSRADLITNTDFKVTAKLFDSKTVSIARGALGDGLFLDFISQNDKVAEGELVVTNGNDLFPPGLIIGKINKISSDDGSLFRKISVAPEFRNIDLDEVLILSM